MVRDENLRFMRNRDVYNSDYFNFTLSLASVNAVRASADRFPPGRSSISLIQHLFCVNRRS